MPESPNLPSSSYSRANDFLDNGAANVTPSQGLPARVPSGAAASQTPATPAHILDGIFGNLKNAAKGDNPFMGSLEYTNPIKTELKHTLRYQDPEHGFDPLNPELEYQYGDRQGFLEQLGHNTLKFSANAVGAFVEGIATIPLALNAVQTGKFDALYNNKLTNTIAEWTEGLETTLPNFQSHYEATHPVMSYINPAYFGNSWGGVLKNLGYTAGAIASAIATDAAVAFATGGAGVAPLLGPQMLSIMGKVGKIFAAEKGALRVAESLAHAKNVKDAVDATYKTAKIADRFRYGLSLTTSAMAEAAIEANQTFRNIENSLYEDFRARYGRDPMGDEQAEIQSLARSGGNADFALNTALLTLTNALTFGSVLQPRAAAIRTVESRIAGGTKIGLKKGSLDTFEVVADSAKRFKLLRSTLAGPSRLLRANASEGFEEGMQYAFQRSAEDYALRKFRDKNISNVDNFMRSAGVGLSDTLTTREGLESIFMGIMSGAVIHGGKKLLEAKRGIDANKNRIIGSTLSMLNGERLTGLFENKYNEAVTADSIAEDMQKALESGDIFEYKNLKFQQLYNFVSSGIRAGKFDLRVGQLESLKDLRGQEFENMFGFSFSETNKKTVDAYVDSVIGKAETIKKNIDKVSQVFKNPYSNKPAGAEYLNYVAFEEYKDLLALDLSEMDDNKRRLTELAGEMDALVPSMDKHRVIDLTHKVGLEQARDNFQARIKEIDASLELLSSAKSSDAYKQAVKEKEWLQKTVPLINESIELGYHPDIYAEIGDILNYYANGNTPNGPNTINPIDLLPLLQKAQDSFRLINANHRSLYHYQALTSKKGFDGYIAGALESYNQRYKKALNNNPLNNPEENVGDSEGVVDLDPQGNPVEKKAGAQKVNVDQTDDGVNAAERADAAKEGKPKKGNNEKANKAAENARKEYEAKADELEKKKKQKAAQSKAPQAEKPVDPKAAEDVKKKEAELKQKQAELAAVTAAPIGVDPTNSGVNITEGKTGMEALNEHAAKAEALQKEIEELKRELNYTRENAADAQVNNYIKDAEIEELEKEVERLRREAETAQKAAVSGVTLSTLDASEEVDLSQIEDNQSGEVQQREERGRYGQTDPLVLLNRVFSRDFEDSKERSNLRSVLFSGPIQNLYQRLVLLVNKATKGKTSAEYSRIQGTNLYRQGYGVDLDLVVDGNIIGKIQPHDSLYFKRGDAYVSLYELTEEEYAAVTGNRPDTYDAFMADLAAYRTIVSPIMTAYKGGKTEFSNDEVQALFDLLPRYGAADYAYSANDATLIKDLKYRSKGDALISLPMVLENGVWVRSSKPVIVNEGELSKEDRDKLWDYLAQNIALLRRVDSRYFFIFQLPDGQYTTISQTAARPAEADPAYVQQLMDKIKAHKAQPSQMGARPLNDALRNTVFISDANNQKGFGNKLYLQVNKNGHVFLNIHNEKLGIDKGILLPELTEKESVEDIVQYINQRVGEAARSDRQVSRLGIKLDVKNFKSFVPATDNFTIEEVADKLTVAVRPNVFKKDHFSISVVPKGKTARSYDPASTTEDRPQGQPKTVFTPQDKRVIKIFAENLNDISSDAVRAGLKEAIESPDTDVQKAAIEAVFAQVRDHFHQARKTFGDNIVEAVYPLVGGRALRDRASTKAALQQIFGLDAQQASAVATIYDQVAKTWAERTGKTKEEFYRGLAMQTGVAPKGSEVLYQMIGEKGAQSVARHIDNLALARHMEKSGETPKVIYQATGWQRNRDNKWVMEIPDMQFKLGKKDTARLLGSGEATLGKLVHAPELFKAYPKLAKMKVLLDYEAADTTAGEFVTGGTISFDHDLVYEVARRNNVDPTVVTYVAEQAAGITSDLNKLLEIHREILADNLRDRGKTTYQAVAALVELIEKGGMKLNPSVHIQMNPKYLGSSLFLSTLIHEVQHAIQHTEGYLESQDTLNTDKQVFRDDRPDIAQLMQDAEDGAAFWEAYGDTLQAAIRMAEAREVERSEFKYYTYRNSNIEVEARNAQIRAVIPFADRKNALLSQTEDVDDITRKRLFREIEQDEKERTLYQEDYTDESINEADDVRHTLINDSFAENAEVDTKLEDAIIPDFTRDIVRHASYRLRSGHPAVLNQMEETTKRAAIRMFADGTSIIYALTSPNVSSPLHELAHHYESVLSDTERATVLKWTGDKAWGVETSEAFARGFEKYLAEGNAPSAGLKQIFDNFRKWLLDIYKGIAGSDIDVELNDEMRNIYAQMLGGKKAAAVKQAVKTQAKASTTPVVKPAPAPTVVQPKPTPAPKAAVKPTPAPKQEAPVIESTPTPAPSAPIQTTFAFTEKDSYTAQDVEEVLGAYNSGELSAADAYKHLTQMYMTSDRAFDDTRFEQMAALGEAANSVEPEEVPAVEVVIPEQEPTTPTKVTSLKANLYGTLTQGKENTLREFIARYKEGKTAGYESQAEGRAILALGEYKNLQSSHPDLFEALSQIVANKGFQPTQPNAEQPQQLQPEVAPQAAEEKPAAGSEPKSKPSKKEKSAETTVQPEVAEVEEDEAFVLRVADVEIQQDGDKVNLIYKGVVIDTLTPTKHNGRTYYTNSRGEQAGEGDGIKYAIEAAVELYANDVNFHPEKYEGGILLEKAANAALGKTTPAAKPTAPKKVQVKNVKPQYDSKSGRYNLMNGTTLIGFITTEDGHWYDQDGYDLGTSKEKAIKAVVEEYNESDGASVQSIDQAVEEQISLMRGIATPSIARPKLTAEEYDARMEKIENSLANAHTRLERLRAEGKVQEAADKQAEIDRLLDEAVELHNEMFPEDKVVRESVQDAADVADLKESVQEDFTNEPELEVGQWVSFKHHKDPNRFGLNKYIIFNKYKSASGRWYYEIAGGVSNDPKNKGKAVDVPAVTASELAPYEEPELQDQQSEDLADPGVMIPFEHAVRYEVGETAWFNGEEVEVVAVKEETRKVDDTEDKEANITNSSKTKRSVKVGQRVTIKLKDGSPFLVKKTVDKELTEEQIKQQERFKDKADKDVVTGLEDTITVWEESLEKDAREDSVFKYTERFMGIKTILNNLKLRFGLDYEIVDEPDSDWKGRFVDGKVLINLAHVEMDTPFHEYLHPWVEVLSVDNPELYQKLVDELTTLFKNGDPLAEEVFVAVRDSAAYKGLAAEDKMKEALVRYISRRAAENVNVNGERIAEKRASAMRRLINKFREWLGKIWTGAGYKRGGTGLRRIPLTELTTEKINEDRTRHNETNKNKKGFVELPIESMNLQDVADIISLTDISFDLASRMDLIKRLDAFQATTQNATQQTTQVMGDEAKIIDRIKKRLNVLSDTADRRLRSEELKSVAKDLRFALDNADEVTSLNNFVREGLQALDWAADEFKRLSAALNEENKVHTPEEIREMNKKLSVVKNILAFYLKDVSALYNRYADDMEIDAKHQAQHLRLLKRAEAAADGIESRAVDLMTEWLYPAVEHTNRLIKDKYPDYALSKEDFKKQLRWANGDVDRLFFLLGSVSSSKDPVSAIVRDVLFDVMEEAHMSQAATESVIKTTYDQFLKSKGLANDRNVTEEYYKKHYLRKARVRERDGSTQDGKPKYKYVERWAFHEEFLRDQWAADYEAFIESLGEAPLRDTAEYDYYLSQIEDWISKNGSGDKPAEKYRNPAFEALRGDKMFGVLYDFYTEANEKLLEEERLPFGMLPQVSRGLNRFADKGYSGNKVKAAAERALEFVAPRADESSFSETDKNLDGSLHRAIKVAYVRPLDESDLDFALPETVFKYAAAQGLTHLMREVEPNIITLKSLLNKDEFVTEGRKINQVTSSRRTIFDKIFKRPAEKVEPLVNRQLNAFIDDVVYGQTEVLDVLNVGFRKIEEGSPEMGDASLNGNELQKSLAKAKAMEGEGEPAHQILKETRWEKQPNGKWVSYGAGRTIDMNKWGDNMAFLTALNNMAFNITAGVSNVTIGNIQTLGEAIGGKYYRPEDYVKAQRQYFGAMGDFLSDTMSLKKSKITQLGIRYDAIQGEFRDKYGKRFVGSVAQKYATLDTIFFLSHAAEHQIQLTGMLSLMNATKVKTTKGEELSLFDAYEQDAKGFYKLREDVIWTREQDMDFTKRLHGLNKMLNGNYSKFDKAYLQRRWYGKLALVYRKFLYNGFRARWGGRYMDYEIKDVREGYYRAFVKKLVSDVNAYKWDAARRAFTKEGWNEDERYAWNKTVYELGILIGATLIGGALAGAEADEQKDQAWVRRYMTLMMLRLRSDVGLYSIFGPTEIFRMMKNPSAVMQTLSRYGEFLQQLTMDPTQRYKRDTGAFEKGDLVLSAKFQKLLPAWRHVLNLMTPEEQAKFYNLTNKNFDK